MRNFNKYDNFDAIIKTFEKEPSKYSNYGKFCDGFFKYTDLNRTIDLLNSKPLNFEEICIKKNKQKRRLLEKIKKLRVQSEFEKIQSEKLKKRSKEIQEERFRKASEKRQRDLDRLGIIDYNPNYDFIKRRIPSVHIKQPLANSLTIKSNTDKLNVPILEKIKIKKYKNNSFLYSLNNTNQNNSISNMKIDKNRKQLNSLINITKKNNDEIHKDKKFKLIRGKTNKYNRHISSLSNPNININHKNFHFNFETKNKNINLSSTKEKILNKLKIKKIFLKKIEESPESAQKHQNDSNMLNRTFQTINLSKMVGRKDLFQVQKNLCSPGIGIYNPSQTVTQPKIHSASFFNEYNPLKNLNKIKRIYNNRKIFGYDHINEDFLVFRINNFIKNVKSNRLCSNQKSFNIY